MQQKFAVMLCVLLALGLLAISCNPSPESLAAATATLMKANAIATTDALTYETQATRQRMDTHATATAIPFALGVTSATASRDSVGVWVVLLGGALGALVVIALGWAFVRMANTRAQSVPRDASGQLPAFWNDATQTLTDPSRMIGPAITMPARPDTLANVARAVHYLQTGQVQPLERGRVETTDAGADSDHLLAAAQASLAATALAAMFRPDNAESGRAAKIEMFRKEGLPLPGGRGALTAPQTRVIVTGDSAIRAIAEQLGDRIPLPAPQTPPMIDAPPNSFAAVPPPPLESRDDEA